MAWTEIKDGEKSVRRNNLKFHWERLGDDNEVVVMRTFNLGVDRPYTDAFRWEVDVEGGEQFFGYASVLRLAKLCAEHWLLIALKKQHKIIGNLIERLNA